MRGKLRVAFPLPPTMAERCKANALAILKSSRAGFGGNGSRYIYLHSTERIYAFEGHEAVLAVRELNETLDRLHYTIDTPDAALSFVDGSPVLIATDDSGIDHETLFKLGRASQ